ncbi:MAG: hypothetical protein PVG78_11405 [Desulfobacterales bacterium]|jgi:hypothetical protein
MDKIFNGLFKVKEVLGVVLISDNGELRYRKVAKIVSAKPESVDWLSMLNSLAGVQEAELICEHLRVYIRKTETGYLVVLTGPDASPAMVRLNCDLVLPMLKDNGGAKGLRRLFKR